MNIRKVIILACSLAVINAVNVSAADMNINKDGSKITVQMNADSGKTVRISAVKSGYTLSDTEWVCALKEGTANAEGIVTVEFYMPEELNNVSSDGEYIVYGRQNDKEMKNSSFWYASQATRTQLETDFDQKTLEEIVSNESNEVALKAAGFDIDSFGELTPVEQETVVNKVNALIPDLASADTETTASTFNEQVAVLVANTNADKEVLKDALLSSKAIEETEDEDLLDWIVECVDENSPYADFEAMENQIDVAESLYVINNARYSELTELFVTYETQLGLDSSDVYAEYEKVTNKNTVNEDIKEKIDADKPTNATELISIIEACLPSNGVGNSGNGGGSSGGGYTGGGDSSGSIPAIGTGTSSTTVSSESKFNDMAGSKWAVTAVNALYERGIVAGDGSGNFRPVDPVTREEFVKMIVVAADMHNPDAVCDFYDVPSSSWAYSYVASAADKAIVSGVSSTEFGLGQTLTRQDMAVICARVLAKTKGTFPVREDIVFSDENEISDYAKESVHSLYSAEMINGIGDGSFAPKSIATRAQAAQMIYNLFLK